ncbi:hypothetical protein GCM10017776_53490 [Streptomyces griseoluteus]|nr:hypothetical protein GCM10017776_53490 [Streptomyces griseoluteus]
MDPVQRGIRMPGAVLTHRADLHADTAHGQLGREGKGPDPVTVRAATHTLRRSVRHVRFAVPVKRSVSQIHHRLTHPDLSAKKSDF